MTSSAAEGAPLSCYGHAVPPFQAVFPKVFRAGLEVMTLEQLDALARALSEAERMALGHALRPDGAARLLHGLSADKAERLAAHFDPRGEPNESAFRTAYPRLAALTNNTLSLEQLQQVLRELSSEDMASQSLYFGNAGRAAAFSAMKPDRVQAILDHTEDWVFLETGRRALAEIPCYTAKLEKQERIDGKMQDLEVIALKARHAPKSLYMKWLGGPHKGRELLTNDVLLGPGKVRVREGGLLGMLAVTIAVDSALARRGTNHLLSDVGLLPLVELMEREYLRAAPRAEIQRRNLGISKLDGQNVYGMESILPRDRSRGYYAYRTVHYSDYVRGIEVKVEIYDFDDRLSERFHYREVDTQALLSDVDFDPSSRAYKL